MYPTAALPLLLSQVWRITAVFCWLAPSSSHQVVESVEEEELTKAEVVEEDEVEQDEEEGNAAGDQFDIPLYSERAPISNLGSSGATGAATTATPPTRAGLLLLLLLTAPFSWG